MKLKFNESLAEIYEFCLILQEKQIFLNFLTQNLEILCIISLVVISSKKGQP